MRKNGVREIWEGGGKVVNGWLAIPDSISAEVMARSGLDSVTIDMQHGLVEYQAAVTMLQAISITDATPMARVPWNDPIPIMKMLDAGAYGIICPMVNNREECERFVGAVDMLLPGIGALVRPAPLCMQVQIMQPTQTAV